MKNEPKLNLQEPDYYRFLRDFDIEVVAKAIIKVNHSLPREYGAVARAYIRMMPQDLSIPILRHFKAEDLALLLFEDPSGEDQFVDLELAIGRVYYLDQIRNAIFAGELRRQSDSTSGSEANLALLMLHLPDDVLEKAFPMRKDEFSVKIEDILFLTPFEIAHVAAKTGPKIISVCTRAHNEEIMTLLKKSLISSWDEYAELSGYFGDRKEDDVRTMNEQDNAVLAEIKNAFLARYA
jgi:hypothetical protein